MNKPQNRQSSHLEFLSPAGQRRHAAMFRELSAELPKIQTQRRARRRLTLTAGTAIFLVAITAGSLKLNHSKSIIPNQQLSSNNSKQHNDNELELNEKNRPLEASANQAPPTPTSYITRTAVEKSTRWTPVSTAAVQAEHARPRTQRIESDEELLHLLQQAGYKSVGLIRTPKQIIISGNTAAFKTAKPTARPPARNQADESKTGPRPTNPGESTNAAMPWLQQTHLPEHTTAPVTPAAVPVGNPLC